MSYIAHCIHIVFTCVNCTPYRAISIKLSPLCRNVTSAARSALAEYLLESIIVTVHRDYIESRVVRVRRCPMQWRCCPSPAHQPTGFPACPPGASQLTRRRSFAPSCRTANALLAASNDIVHQDGNTVHALKQQQRLHIVLLVQLVLPDSVRCLRLTWILPDCGSFVFLAYSLLFSTKQRPHVSSFVTYSYIKSVWFFASPCTFVRVSY